MPGSYWINNVTAPDNSPTLASTLDGLPVLDHIVFNVANAAIYWSIKLADDKLGHDKFGVWQPYLFALPQSFTLYRTGVVGVRFYAAIPVASLPSGASQAQVTVEAIVP